MPLYSIIVDYARGTYVSQKQADDRDAALRLWLDDTCPESASAPFLHNNKRKRREKLAERLFHPDFGSHGLSGISNVWQAIFRFRGKTGVMHIIRTDPAEEIIAKANASEISSARQTTDTN